jgi:tryptophan halogenase
MSKKILIAGGGSAGLITALILKKKIDCDIEMLIPKDIGIIGVGEGSTDHFDTFKHHINKTTEEILKKTGGTLKAGIMFKDWNNKNKKYLHHINETWQEKLGLDSRNFQYLMSSNKTYKYFTPRAYYKNKVEYKIGEAGNIRQFHFNTFKLNDFLTEEALKQKIKIIDEVILDVVVDDSGIKKIVTKNKKYNADFYIDCTGFKKILISKLGAKWNSYSNNLKVNSAIVFPEEGDHDYDMWTTSQAMKYGWVFKIPVKGRTGNGYIFDDNYITKEQAHEELEKFYNKKINIAKHIKFDPGALDKCWIKNCVAIGLSANFVEPLEATSIGTSIQQSFLLMHYINNYTETDINIYNNTVNVIMNNIKDFIQLHYITDKKNSMFWKDIKHAPTSNVLNQYLKIWKEGKLLKRTDIEFNGNDNIYSLFKEDNFNLIAYFNGLINTKKLKQEYSMITKDLKKYWDINYIKGFKNRNKENYTDLISHKEYIKNINNVY